MPSPGDVRFPILYTPDSRLAAVHLSSAVLLVDVVQRRPLTVYIMSRYGSGARNPLSPDGRLIVASDDGSVITLAETGAHEGVPVEATHIAVQPDNEHLTAVSYTGEVAIHSLGEPERIIMIPSAGDEVSLGKVAISARMACVMPLPETQRIIFVCETSHLHLPRR